VYLNPSSAFGVCCKLPRCLQAVNSRARPACTTTVSPLRIRRFQSIMSLKVGFVGMGIMGEPMAANLLKSKKFASVTVWNRTVAKVCGCDAHAPR
jgi:NAD binding domain of 6-phosphogluconate dehydrogenase